MKKHPILSRFAFCLSMAVLSLVSTSNASFVFPFKVNESESTTLNGNVGDQERVVVSLNYEIKVSQKREEVWGETPIKHFSTTNETDYNNFFTTIKNYNFNSFTNGDTIQIGEYYVPKADGSGQYRLNVTDRIRRSLGWFEWNYYGAADLYESSYQDTVVYDDIGGRTDQISVDSGSLLSMDFFRDYVISILGDGYVFIGLKKTDGGYFDWSDPITGDIDLTASIVKKDAISATQSLLGTTITNLTDGSYSFYASGKGGSYDIASDPGYSVEQKSVFLSAPAGGSLTIQDGVTVNMILNDGSSGIKNTSGNQVVSVRNQSSKILQYRIVLQDDLTIFGNLVLCSNFGQSNSNAVQSNITGSYVELDLNGHDIIIKNGGKLESYGSVVDSVGSGTIYVDGGTLQTLAVILNYKGGSSTSSMALDKAFPFDAFTFPYLECRAVIQHDGATWGKIVAFCNIFVGTVITAQISDFTLNFIGPAGGDYFFELQSPSGDDSEVVFQGSRIDGMENGLASNDAVLTYGLSQRIKTEFRHVRMAVRKFVFDIKMVFSTTIDTSEFIFPIPSFFDLSFVDSAVRITQPIKLMPGSSFVADEDSLVCLGYDSSSRSAQVSVFDKSLYYVDRSSGTFIKKDYAVSSTSGLSPSDSSNAFQKYFGPSQVKVYGTLVFQTGNSTLYRLAGAIDFNKIAYTSTSSVPSAADITFVDYDSSENPFEILRLNYQVNIETFGFDTALANDSRHAKGYARPLVSFGTAYFTSSTLSFVGTYDFTSGVLKDSDGQVYLFDCGANFEARDEQSCKLLSGTYDPSSGLFSSGGNTYVYFASMYFTSDGLTIGTQSALSRLGDSNTAFSIKWDGTRYLRV